MDWTKQFKINALSLGMKQNDTNPMYKLVGFTRKYSSIALKSKIEEGSPLYLAGYRNKYTSNYIVHLLIFLIKYTTYIYIYM